MIQIKVITMDGEKGANSVDTEEVQSTHWLINLGGACFLLVQLGG